MNIIPIVGGAIRKSADGQAPPPGMGHLQKVLLDGLRQLLIFLRRALLALMNSLTALSKGAWHRRHELWGSLSQAIDRLRRLLLAFWFTHGGKAVIAAVASLLAVRLQWGYTPKEAGQSTQEAQVHTTVSILFGLLRFRTSLSVSLGRPGLHKDNLSGGTASLPITHNPSSQHPSPQAGPTASSVPPTSTSAVALQATSGVWFNASDPAVAADLLHASGTTSRCNDGAATDGSVSRKQSHLLDNLEHVNVFCSQEAKRDILAFLQAQAALVGVSAEARAAMGHGPAESSCWSASGIRAGATTVTSYGDGGSSSCSPLRSSYIASPFPFPRGPAPDPRSVHNPNHHNISHLPPGIAMGSPPPTINSASTLISQYSSLSLSHQLAPSHSGETDLSIHIESHAGTHGTEITIREDASSAPSSPARKGDTTQATLAPGLAPGLAFMGTLQRAAAAAAHWLPHSRPSSPRGLSDSPHTNSSAALNQQSPFLSHPPSSKPTDPFSAPVPEHTFLEVKPKPIKTQALTSLAPQRDSGEEGNSTPNRNQQLQQQRQASLTDGGSVTSGPPPPSSPAQDFDVATAVGHRLLLRSPPGSAQSTPSSYNHAHHFETSGGGAVSTPTAAHLRQEGHNQHGELRSGAGSTTSSYSGRPHSFAAAVVQEGSSVRGSLDLEFMGMDPTRWRNLIDREGGAGL